MNKLLSDVEQVEFLVLAHPLDDLLGDGLAQLRPRYRAMSQAERLSLINDTRAAEQLVEKDAWVDWALRDLWSLREFTEICSGIVPNTPNRTGAQQIAINEAKQFIDRGMLSNTLACVVPESASKADRMYDTHLYFVPVVAAQWAFNRFDTFPAELWDVVQGESVHQGKKLAWPWGQHETKHLADLAAAATEWWSQYDSTKPESAPKNDAVASWLMDRGVTENIAKAMATILRAEDLPSGRKRNGSTQKKS